jgi:energy-coupling factor transporter ATP-binding protein EcfA2
MPPLVDVRGLRFRYPNGTQALDGVDFTLEAGESVALFGANGSGKTTFAMHLNGLLEGEGTVHICGLAAIAANRETIRRKVGMVFQDADSQLFMPSVMEDVAFGLVNRGMPAPAAIKRAGEALGAVGMQAAANRAPYHLSAGEKKRVALAGILAMDPDILVLDEPTTFLDPPTQRNLADLLRELPQAKIVVTHNTRFALAVCDRAVFFERGKIVARGSVEEIVARFDWDFASQATNLEH